MGSPRLTILDSFVPSQANQSEISYISCTNQSNNDWVMKMSGKEDTNEVHAFQTTLLPSKDTECVLIFNQAEKCFILEKLDATLAFAPPTRGASGAKASSGASTLNTSPKMSPATIDRVSKRTKPKASKMIHEKTEDADTHTLSANDASGSSDFDDLDDIINQVVATPDDAGNMSTPGTMNVATPSGTADAISTPGPRSLFGLDENGKRDHCPL